LVSELVIDNANWSIHPLRIDTKRVLSFVRSYAGNLCNDILLCDEIKQSILTTVCRGMPTFKSPTYSKQTNAKGQLEVSYIFPIEYPQEDGFEVIVDSTDMVSTDMVEHCIGDNKDWWNTFLQDFLQQSAKFFSKQYTVQDISKVLRHVIIQDKSAESNEPCTVILLPKHIQIMNGQFTIHWKYTCQPIKIDIPGLSEEPLPDLEKTVDGVAELNMDELPLGGGDTTESIDISDPNKLYEKQKVKEAILRAKVAYYRAQNKIRTFSDKYGNSYSDSEFELEDTDNESGDEDEDEDEEEEDK